MQKIAGVSSFKRMFLGHDQSYYLEKGKGYLTRAEQQKNSNIPEAQRLFIKSQDTLNKILPAQRNAEVEGCLAQAYLGQGDVLRAQGLLLEARALYEKARPYRPHEVEQKLAALPPSSLPPAVPTQRQGQHTIAAVYGRTIPPLLSSPPQTQAAVFFKHDACPITHKPYQVEEEIAQLQGTRHLAYCLQQATLSEAQKKPLTDLAAKIVDLFAGRATKTLLIVQEITPLARIPDPEIYQSLLNQALKTLKEPLLNANVMQGLAVMIRYCPEKLVEEGTLSSSDLMDGLKVLLERLQSAYQYDKDTTRLQTLLQTLTQLLEAMALIGVTGISRKHMQEPLKKILGGLSKHSHLTIQFQARYARQALAHIPNDESTSQAVARRTVDVAKGILTLANAVKTLDPVKLLDTFEHFSEAFSGADEITKELISLAKEFYEAGSTVQKGGTEIREGMDFNRRHRWYAALQATDILLAEGQFSQLEVFVRNSPYRQHADFLQGLCQRLEQIARSHQDEAIQRAAIDFLGDLIQNPAQWKSHSEVKQSASHALERLAAALTGTVQTRAQELLKQSNPNWTPAAQTGQNYVPPVWASTWQEGPSSQLLSEARGDLAHFRRQQEIELQSKQEPLAILGQNIEAEYFTAWEEPGEIQDGLAMYVAPQATTVTDTNTLFNLDDAVTTFLTQKENAGQKTRVLLLRGEAGSGKSTFDRQLARRLWREYSAAPASDERPIPLYIALQTIDKPHQNLIGQYLSDTCRFSPEQIEALRKSQRFILILDGYDEIPAEQRNLYADKQLDQWQAKIILSCRPEYLTEGYQNHLQPRGYSRLLLEYQLASFSEPLINTYIDQYVKHTQAKWSAQQYKDTLARIPNVNALLGTPFLLKMALSVLPTLDKVQFDQVGLTRIQLYAQFVQMWFERALDRLKAIQSKLTDAQQKAFCNLEDEFIGHSQVFNTDLALAMAEAKTTMADYSAIARRGVPQDKRYEPFLSSKDEEKNLLRFSALLIRQHQQYKFIHKSIQDYLVARAVWEELENASERDASHGAEPLNEIKHVRVLWDALPPTIPVNPTALLNQFNLVEEVAIQRFLVERVQQNRALVKLLLAWIKASTSQDTVSTAAANAITILVRAGVPFNGVDLKGIQIPGADLSFGIFDSAQLQRTDLTGANLRNSWLREANLSGAQMAGVQFGEWPYLQEEGGVCSCAYSPDGKTFAIGLHNGNISVYDTLNWEKIHTSTLRGHNEIVMSVVYSPSGQQIASASEGNTIRLWDAHTGELGHILQGHTDCVHSVVYSPSGEQIASGSRDNTVRLWDAHSGTLGYTLEGHTSSVNSVVYSPSGLQIASGSSDNTVRLWDAHTGEPGLTLRGHTEIVFSVVYSPSGEQIASSSLDKTVRLWDAHTGEPDLTLQGPTENVFGVAYSPNGEQIASGNRDNTVRLWDAHTGEPSLILPGHTGPVVSVVYSPSGDQIASGSLDKTVRLWDTHTGEPRHTLPGHTADVLSVVYSPSGHQIASGSLDKTVRLWDARTGEPGLTLQGHTDSVRSVAYSPSGQQIASGSWDTTVRLWDAHTGMPGLTLPGHTDRVVSVVYSPSGEQIASGGRDKTVRLWDAQTGEPGLTLQGHTNFVVSVAYSPSGQQIASSSLDKTVRLWDAHSGTLGYTLEGHTSSVNSVVYSPSGLQIASGSSDNTVRLWDAHTGEPGLTLRGHTYEVLSMVYSPSGHQIASGSMDTTVRLWEVKTGQCQMMIQDCGIVMSVAWRKNAGGHHLGIGSMDKSVRQWGVKKEGEEYKAVFCWSSTHSFLTVRGTSIEGVRGLSQINQKLLKQRGAVGEPSSRSEAEAHLAVELLDQQKTISDAFIQKLKEETDSSPTYEEASKDGLWSRTEIDNDMTPSLYNLADVDKNVRKLLGNSGFSKLLSLSQHLIEDPESLQSLARQVQLNPDFKDFLLDLVKRSKMDADFQITAANALTTLVKAKVPLTGENFSGIRVPRADLSYGIFDHTQFENADLSQTNFQGAWLRKANFKGATLAGVEFGEMPTLALKAEASACSYSSNGLWLAVATNTGIGLYHQATTLEPYILRGDTDTGAVHSIAFSPNNEWLACGKHDGTIQLWSMEKDTAVLRHTLKEHDHKVLSIAFSQDSKLLVSSDNENIKLWKLNDIPIFVHTFIGHTDKVLSVALSHSAGTSIEWLASGSNDNTIRLWDVKKGTLVHILEGHTSWVNSVAFSPDNEWLASASADKTIKLWKLGAGEAPCQYTLEDHSYSVRDIAFSSDNKWLASASIDRTVKLWARESYEPKHTFEGHSDSVEGVAFSPDSKWLASSSTDKTVRIRSIEHIPSPVFGEHTNFIKHLVFSPNGKLFASGEADKTVKVWDAQTHALLHTFQGQWTVAFSLDNKLALANHNKIELWSIETSPFALLSTLKTHTDSTILDVVFSPDGRWLTLASENQSVELLSLETNTSTKIGDSIDSVCVAFSSDSRKLASVSYDGTIGLYALATNGVKLSHTLEGHGDQVYSIALSRDSNWLASASYDGTIGLYALATDEPELACIFKEHSDRVYSIAFSRDSNWLASASYDKTIKLWNVRTDKSTPKPEPPERTFTGHTDSVYSVAFSPNGERLISGSADMTVRLWSIASNKCLAVIQGFYGGISSIVWQDDNTFLTSGEDRTIRLWQIIGPKDDTDAFQVNLCWASHQTVLAAVDISIGETKDLSEINQLLLTQKAMQEQTLTPTQNKLVPSYLKLYRSGYA